MAQPRRIKRLESLILQIAAETLHREITDPRIGMVTITRIKLAPDMTQAKVYWSCLETEGARRRIEQAMESALPLFQRRVAEELSTRVTPQLQLEFDDTLENAQKLDKIFHKLREERGEDEETEDEGAEAEGTDADEAPAEGDPADPAASS